MKINLEDHVLFIEHLQMEVVPLSIAKKAVKEAQEPAEIVIFKKSEDS